jgi:ParB family chromosome partitioning protein
MPRNDKPTSAELPLSALHPFPNHPYKVTDDEAMFALMDSIDAHGVLSPVLVRPEKDGYEIISGHRRCHAAKAVGLKTVPAIVCDLSRSEAAILLVDSNLHREHLLPSEKAFAYKLKMDAIKHQGKSMEGTSCKTGTKSRSDELLAEDSGESARTIQRYIRLTNLIPELLGYLDRGEMALSVGEALSYLDEEMQYVVLDAMEAEDCTPSYSQAVRLKNLSRCGDLNEECIMAVMQEQKANQRERVSIPAQDIRRFFPAEYTTQDIERSIVRMLEAREQSRKAHGRGEER